MKKINAYSIWLVAAYLALAPESGKAETLEQAFVQAYQTNPVLAAERAKLRQVDEQVSQALSNWRPSVDAQAYAGRIYQDTPNNSLVVPSQETIDTRAVGVQLTQPIFRGFRTVSSVRAAEKQVAAQRATLRSIEQQVFLDTGTAYLDVMRDQAVVDLNTEYQNVLRKQLHETQDRFQAHDVTKTDIDQAIARLKRSEAGRSQASANLAGHRAAYFHLTGNLPGKLQVPKLDLPAIKTLDEAVTLARRQNPAIQAAGHNEEEAQQEVDLNKGSLLPEVNLVGSAQRQWGISTLIPGRQDTAQVLVQMTIPLYRTGADYSKTRAALQTVTERRMRLEDSRREAEQTVVTAWQNLMASRDVIAAYKIEEEAAARARHGVKIELPAGTRDTLDVLNAEQELLDARIGLVQAQHDEALAVLQIRAATGALTAEALKLPVSLYDPDIHYEAARDAWFGFDTPSGEPESSNAAQPVTEKTSEPEENTPPHAKQTWMEPKEEPAPTAPEQATATPAAVEQVALKTEAPEPVMTEPVASVEPAAQVDKLENSDHDNDNQHAIASSRFNFNK